jgi:stage V sporulation protein G
MEITEIKIVPIDEERLRASINITFDDCFRINGLKLIKGKKGYLLSMPQRKRRDGTHVDIVSPIDSETRRMIEEKVFAEYEKVTGETIKRRVLK